MEILRKPIREITFDKVVAFCEQEIIEGIQLDYKKDLSAKGLAKHFAAFSNARGGLIIIGVEEDNVTGKPTKWEGIDPAGKHEDQIHQNAQNVDPIPSYDVHTTNPGSNGKVFILVRIFEGDRTPYYVLNDATIYIRTGNTTKRCEEQASPQETARLFGKAEGALAARDVNLQRAELVYRSTLERFFRQIEKSSEHSRMPDYGKSTAITPNRGALTLAIQPHFPEVLLAHPRELQIMVNDIYLKSQIKRFPWLCSSQNETIPDGILIVNSCLTGTAKLSDCQQVLASGLIFGREYPVSDYGGVKIIRMSHVVSEIYCFLVTVSTFYREFSYQGGLIGHVEMTNLEDLLIQAFAPTQEHVYDPHDILLPSYKWPINIDSFDLFDNERLKESFIGLINEIGWGLGWHYDHREFLSYHIEKNHWFVQ